MQKSQIHMGSLEQGSCNEQMASKGECFNQLNLPTMWHWGNILCTNFRNAHMFDASGTSQGKLCSPYCTTLG